MYLVTAAAPCFDWKHGRRVSAFMGVGKYREGCIFAGTARRGMACVGCIWDGMVFWDQNEGDVKYEDRGDADGCVYVSLYNTIQV